MLMTGPRRRMDAYIDSGVGGNGLRAGRARGGPKGRSGPTAAAVRLALDDGEAQSAHGIMAFEHRCAGPANGEVAVC